MLAFDTQGSQRRKKPRAADVDQRRQNARPFFCAACLTRVCDDGDIVAIGGATRHRFTNPAGFTFEIGTFARAPGCRADGEPTLEHTWFPEHAWSLANCANCTTQLGWFFAGATSFFGLIWSRLIQGA